MPGRQPVRVTYAHKRRRVQNAGKKLLSSPLEVLPPDVDDLTRTQMAHRMLKRSRRVALTDHSEDKNVEHIRGHLAKRIKRTQERVSTFEPTDAPSEAGHQSDFTFQTPFPSLQSVHESAIAKSTVPDQLSPVPVSKRVMSRTSSRNLKENGAQSHILMSPFSSRPGSAAPSPRRKGKERTFHRASRVSPHAKSRTLSGVFKGNSRRVPRKDSTTSLKDVTREPSMKRIKHQRYPSSPSTAYMRSRFTPEDWIAPPKAFSRTFDDRNEIPSPGGSFHANASFYADQPQSYSTPATSRLQKLPDLDGRQAKTDNFLASISLRKDSLDVDGPDVEMMDGTIPQRRQAIHLSGNSIFSSSDEFTIGSLAAVRASERTVERSDGWNEVPSRVPRQVPILHGAGDKARTARSLAGSFITEYDIPLAYLHHSPASTAATNMLGLDGVTKVSVGEQSLGLPGTSPAHGGNLVIRTSRNSIAKSSLEEQALGLPGTSPPHGQNVVGMPGNRRATKSSVGERLLGSPGTNPARGENFVRTSGNIGTLTPPASPPNAAVSCPPSSPASDLALGLQSMGIRGPDMHSDGETRPSASVPLQTRVHSLRDPLTGSTAKKSAKRRPVRKRAGTIRASDFTKPSGPSSGVGSGPTVTTLSNVRRTRSGTVVGPDSKLAAKSAALPSQTIRGAPARLAAVASGSESESDDELLLKSFWVEGLEYLGIPVPRDRKDAEADELNLGGVQHVLESDPPRRPGMRRR